MRTRAGSCAARAVKFALLAIAAALLYAGVRFGPDLYAAYKAGFLDKTQLRAYQGTSIENLKAIHTALMLYHDSEGQFPSARGWMDAVKPRLKTNDLKPEEALKKLRNPTIQPPGEDVYGYAMNVAVSQKYKDDLKDPDSTILVFDSKDTRWNAFGDPMKDAADPPRPGGNQAVTVGGKVVPLPAR